MSKVVDCRGLSCPQPVIQTKQALEETDKITVIVDNSAARDNVSRFVESQGGTVVIDDKKDGIYITVEKSKDGKHQEKAQPSKTPEHGPIVVVVPNDQMGRGERELGHILIRSFLHTLTELSNRPDTMIFFNTGVKLTVEGSEVRDDLRSWSAAPALTISVLRTRSLSDRSPICTPSPKPCSRLVGWLRFDLKEALCRTNKRHRMAWYSFTLQAGRYELKSSLKKRG
jgi:selenium metabolism protein YedF